MSEPTLDNKPVIIIGGGWSGLACAVTLAEHGIKTRLFESARQPGGRARSIPFKKAAPGETAAQKNFKLRKVDNGQHIMLGAYHATLSLFKIMGLVETDLVERHTLALNLFSPNQPSVRLKAPSLPAPLHLIAALISMQGLTVAERFTAINMALKLALKKYSLKNDMSVHDLLIHYQQSSKAIQTLWEPLCLATMNTPIHYASAQVFLNVLKDSFSIRKNDSDLLFFKSDLSHIFCKPAVKFIHQHHGQVDCASKVIELSIHYSPAKRQTEAKPVIDFMTTTANNSYHSDTVVLAVPPHISNKLLHSKNNCAIMQSASFLIPKNASLNYHYEPICTVYLQYPQSIKLPSRMVGFFDTIGQWAIDRSLCQQPGLIAIVISGPGKHLEMSHNQLADSIHSELKSCIGNLPQWLDYRISTEKKATFSCRVDIESQRPLNNTMIPGLYLAGDYTSTHYPATIEGAVKSGINAAKQIILAKG